MDPLAAFLQPAARRTLQAPGVERNLDAARWECAPQKNRTLSAKGRYEFRP